MSVLAEISEPQRVLSTTLITDCAPDDLVEQKHVAVAVSGGPDSMALVKLLSLWSGMEKGPTIHALIVNHNIRKEAKAEAKRVATRVKKFAKVKAKVLACDLSDQTSGIQEAARNARYDLFEAYCAKHKIKYLFLGHHQDDQAETVLFRLAKGSGLDGLSGMQSAQEYSEDLTLLRPLLRVSKADLLEFCDDMGIDVEHDPSNENDRYARVRLRQSMDVLSEEGLSPKRLSTVAYRISRARKALEEIADEAFYKILVEKDTNRIVLHAKGFSETLDEIAFRAILKAIKLLSPEREYLPRMEKIEDLFEDLKFALKHKAAFRKRTLGGLVFELDEKDHLIIIAKEK